MAYDQRLADRVHAVLDGQPGWSTRAMFGGLAFLLDGHMAVAVAGASGDGLMVRCDPDDRLLTQAHVAPVEMRGRPMTGWVLVDVAGLADDAELARWVAVGAARVRALHSAPPG